MIRRETERVPPLTSRERAQPTRIRGSETSLKRARNQKLPSDGAGETPQNQRSASRRINAPPAAASETRITLTLNGARKQISIAPWTTLLDALREHLDLTGTKKGCDHGQCGACTVLVNGKRVLSCLTLAIMRNGAEITTIEGLAEGETLHPLQEAFIEHDAFQCGYCTPGQICSAVGLIREGKAKTPDDIRELMSGNLCRCGAYPNIIAAIQDAMKTMSGATSSSSNLESFSSSIPGLPDPGDGERGRKQARQGAEASSLPWARLEASSPAFKYTQTGAVSEAVIEIERGKGGQFIAGGTNLIDLMKETVARPARLVDVSRLPLDRIENTPEGGLLLGALVTNANTAYHPEVERRYPLLAKAILAGASAQIRNMATNGGNLLQRTRCSYFYDIATPCNKREPGAGCSAIEGFNRMHAILGASPDCIAVHPSDMCVALAALNAVVRVRGKGGERTIPFAEFHRLPGDTPQRDTNLLPGEIITAIELPAQGFAEHHAYLKVRDRTSFAFALVSVAAALELDGETITEARLALGGVAHKPWRDPKAESLLRGKSTNPETFERVAEAVLRGAQGFGFNNFKIELARRAMVRALTQAVRMENTHDHQVHRTTTEPR